MDQLFTKSFKTKPSQKKKTSGGSKRSFSASTASVRGLESSSLWANLSNTDYLKDVGLLEFVRSSVLENANKKRVVGVYKTAEEYHEEVLSLKKKIKEMDVEMSAMKFKVRRGEEELNKRQKLIGELLNAKTTDMPGKASLDSSTVVNNLKMKIAKVEEMYREKESALKKLHSDIRVTNIQEMEIEIETLKSEIQRLNKLVAKEEPPPPRDKPVDDRSRKKKRVPDKAAEEQIKKLTSTILKISTDKNRLLLENKSLKINLQKSIEMQESAKQNFDAAMERASRQEPLNDNREEQKVSGPNPPEVLKRHEEKKKELEAEVDRLSKIIIKIKEERNYYRDRCSELEKNAAGTGRSSRQGRLSAVETPGAENGSAPRVAPAVPGLKVKKKSPPPMDNSDVEFIQSLVRNHKFLRGTLYDLSSARKSVSKGSESLTEAVELIQAIARSRNKRV